MKDTKAAGFGIVEIFVVTTIVFALGFLGWYKFIRNTAKPYFGAETTQSGPQWSEPIKISAGSRLESKDNAFSIAVPGGWIMERYENQTAISSTGSCRDTFSCGNEIDPDKTAMVQSVDNFNIDFYSKRFAVYAEDRFALKFISKGAEKKKFGPVDGVIGKRYYQKVTEPKEHQKAKLNHELYEYEFKKNGRTYHVYYDIYPGEQNHIDSVENMLRTLKFNN